MFRGCTVIKSLMLLFLLNLGEFNVHSGLVDGCHEAEREALLVFKQTLVNLNHSLLFSSWKGIDCCSWEGIGCNNVTSHVNRLDLHNPECPPYVSPIPQSPLSISPKLDNSLLELRHLSYLDMSCNDFQYSQIPRFFGSFKYLRYLNLSFCNFTDIVPSQISNLTTLQNLDLSFNYLLSSDLNWVGNLVNLQYLNLGEMIISLSRDSMHALTKLPSLLDLRLSNCRLGTIPPIYNSTWQSRIQHLDLSSNYLIEPQLSRVLSNITSLRYLDLSYNQFNGTFPLWLRNMYGLEYLDLSENSFSGNDGGSVIDILENFCKLKALSLSFASVKGSLGDNHNFSKCFAYDLEMLVLSDNMITGTLPSWLWEFKYLRKLFMPDNGLVGPIPASIKSLAYLEDLDLSSNRLNGKIPPHIGSLSSLVHVDLSKNSLNGQIPPRMGNLLSLKYLDLSDNNLNGQIPPQIESLSSLEYFDLSSNNLNGQIPPHIQSLSSLEYFDLSSNNLNGQIPPHIGNLSTLEHLDLSGNNLRGTIPAVLGRCKDLQWIDLSSNFLQGEASESHLANLSKLIYLDLSYNPLNLYLGSNFSPSFQLSELQMTSCKIKSSFPRWIAEQTQLAFLDLSDNMIFGELPTWFSSSQLISINISHNRMTGLIPYFSSSQISVIDLSYNLLSGPLFVHEGKNDIPGTHVCQLPGLRFLDLQRNKIVGTIPDYWGSSNDLNYIILNYINLSSNNLSGNIPTTIGLLPNLEFLKLSNNSLQGSIPPTFSTSSSLQILDLGENKLVGNLINWSKTSHPYLKIIRLRGNHLVGDIPSTLCSLSSLQLLDLADNKLTGDIPHCFGHFVGMGYVVGPAPAPGLAPALNPDYIDPRDDITVVVLKGAELQYTTTLQYVVSLDLSCNALVGSIPDQITNLSLLIGLNLSYNHLIGNIPHRIGEMKSLQSLDLSENNISGTIPLSISELTSLSSLNLSYNHLHGQIPTGNQLQTLNDPSAYEGNSGLCGDPLPNTCNPKPDQHQEQEENDKEEDREKPLFYFVIFSGFATGFWGVVGSLLLKSRFRFGVFQLVDRITDYLYVQVMIRINRIRN